MIMSSPTARMARKTIKYTFSSKIILLKYVEA
jgi:hypothetical protein